FFQKSSDKTHHYPATQKLWRLCYEAGDIYKKKYKGLYCTGCEAFYTTDELDKNGYCLEHPGKKLDYVEEENYFFKLSNYQNFLFDLISNDKLTIIPNQRKNEVLAFIEKGLEDISISRSNRRAKYWGVPVPNDPSQRIYVWFDALNIYQSGIGFGWNSELYQKWWPADIHFIGKGIARFHAIYWPAFLKSAGLKLPKKIFIHGYLTINGQKISKTLGNIVDPLKIIDKFGTDPLRYYLLKEVPTFDDGDFSEIRMVEIYNGELANGLGNLVSRITKLASDTNYKMAYAKLNFWPDVRNFLLQLEINQAIKFIWKKISEIDKYLNENQPWLLKGKTKNNVVGEAIYQLAQIAYNLQPFMPETANIILSWLNSGMRQPFRPLFPRISKKQ
ncbi:MAG: methionine--tRNA ligase, partial [Nitrososphaerota archaeon]